MRHERHQLGPFRILSGRRAAPLLSGRNPETLPSPRLPSPSLSAPVGLFISQHSHQALGPEMDRPEAGVLHFHHSPTCVHTHPTKECIRNIQHSKKAPEVFSPVEICFEMCCRSLKVVAYADFFFMRLSQLWLICYRQKAD